MTQCRHVEQGGPLGSGHSTLDGEGQEQTSPGNGRRAFQAKPVNGQSPGGGTEPSLFKALQDRCLEPGRGAPRIELAQTAKGQSRSCWVLF